MYKVKLIMVFNLFSATPFLGDYSAKATQIKEMSPGVPELKRRKGQLRESIGQEDNFFLPCNIFKTRRHWE